jgi:hypothetical protein
MEQVKVTLKHKISRVYQCAARDGNERHKVSHGISVDTAVSQRLIHIDDLTETFLWRIGFSRRFFHGFERATRPPLLEVPSTASVMTSTVFSQFASSPRSFTPVRTVHSPIIKVLLFSRLPAPMFLSR